MFPLSFGNISATVPWSSEIPIEHLRRVFEAMVQWSEQVIYRKGIVTKHFRYPLYHHNPIFRQRTAITF